MAIWTQKRRRRLLSLRLTQWITLSLVAARTEPRRSGLPCSRHSAVLCGFVRAPGPRGSAPPLAMLVSMAKPRSTMPIAM